MNHFLPLSPIKTRGLHLLVKFLLLLLLTISPSLTFAGYFWVESNNSITPQKLVRYLTNNGIHYLFQGTTDEFNFIVVEYLAENLPPEDKQAFITNFINHYEPDRDNGYEISPEMIMQLIDHLDLDQKEALLIDLLQNLRTERLE